MNDETTFRLLPDSASTLAGQVDSLFLYILAICLFFTLLIATLIIVFIIRYRRRPGVKPAPIEGSLRLEIVWTAIPLALAMSIFAWGAHVYMEWVTPPDDALDVYVVGRQWMWKAQHPGGQSEINELHVPLGRPVRITLTSIDVIHSFYIPDLRAHMDAIPGRYTTAWFEATKPGRYRLFCSEYCGTNHSAMIGTAIVLEPDAYQAWLSSGADLSLATKGQQLFQKLQCVTCHSADSKARAPVLESIYLKRVPLHDGKIVVADEDYLRESVRKPSAKIVAGFQSPSIMPPFGEDVVSEDEMRQLLTFLKTLGPGQTPKRV